MSIRRPLNVLVIDDEPGFGESLKGVLESVGCRVDFASTPYAGITLSDTIRYDFVLVDLKMPQMDGLEVLRFLQPRGHRCMLMTTAFTGAVTRDEVREAG